MLMLDIIDWCNSNQGFIGALLSLLTLIVSIIAIIISVITARNPYKRKLAVSGGTSVGIGFEFAGLNITAVNVGNMPVMIKTIGIKIGKDIYINVNTITESRVMLKPTETTTQYFYDENFKIFKELKPYKRAYAYVEDTEGRKYKKYIGQVKSIQKYFCK